MAHVSIASLNTRGLNDPVKCQTAFDFLYSEGNDIFLLQECNIPYKDSYKSFEERWSHGPSIWSGDNDNRSSGVAVLFKGRRVDIKRVQHTIQGRVLCIDIELDNACMRIINVYCPADLQKRLETLRAIQPLLVCSSEVILGGDFNCLVDAKDRLSTGAVRLDSSTLTLKNILIYVMRRFYEPLLFHIHPPVFIHRVQQQEKDRVLANLLDNRFNHSW